jgi:Na+-translocating ferredoxin:NAD+ oxidoreductase subunit B
MKSREDVYQRLRGEIDKMPIAYPKARSGSELRLLRHLFTPEEAEVAVHLNILPETVSRIRTRLRKNGIDMSAEKIENMLDGLVEKGAILTDRFAERRKGKRKRYSLVQIVIGMFEFQVDRITGGFARDFNEYFDDPLHKSALEMNTWQMRTIPIGTSLSPDMRVADYNNIRKYVSNLEDDISVMNCVCRQSSDVIGKPCTHSDLRETCLMFHDAARLMRGRGIGRWISREETHALLDRAEKEGFILQPENCREPSFLCVCCRDCCHDLKLLRLHPRPSEYVHAPYRAQVDASKCTGCKKCFGACPMEAISMHDKTAVVNPDRCIGCGVCSAVCAYQAHSMIHTGRTYIPPKTSEAMYQKIMIERFGFTGTMKAVARVFTGRKA